MKGIRGLTSSELAKNFAVVVLIILSTQILGVFDTKKSDYSNNEMTTVSLISILLLYLL